MCLRQDCKLSKRQQHIWIKFGHGQRDRVAIRRNPADVICISITIGLATFDGSERVFYNRMNLWNPQRCFDAPCNIANGQSRTIMPCKTVLKSKAGGHAICTN